MIFYQQDNFSFVQRSLENIRHNFVKNLAPLCFVKLKHGFYTIEMQIKSKHSFAQQYARIGEYRAEGTFKN